MRLLITLILLLSITLGFSQTKDIDSLSIELAFQNQDSTKIDTSLKLIKSLYEIEEYDRALKYIIESEKLSTKLNYIEGITEITYYKALIYAQKDDYINAISGYNKAKILYKSLNNTIGVSNVNNSIGLIEIKRGNYAKGLQYCLSAIKELENRGLKKELLLSYTNLAKVYYDINIYDKSIEFNLKTLEVQEQLNDINGQNLTNAKLANLYSIKNEHRKAIEYYEKVLEAVKKEDTIRAYIYPKLGGEYLEFNDFDSAKKHLVKGYNLNRKSKNKTNYLTALNNLGDLNTQQNRLKIAEKQLIEAGTIARRTDNKQELLKYYKLRKVLDSTKKKFDRAFVWQRKYYDLKDIIDKNNANKNLDVKNIIEASNLNNKLIDDTTSTSNLALSFNATGPSETLLPLLSKNRATIEQQEEKSRYNYILYGLFAALLIVSSLLILIYLKRNSNIKYTQELEEKNLKIELQNEAFSEQTKHLENVNNVKDKLFSIVSHDLKDSLSSINGFIDLLKDGSLSRDEFDNLVPELSENANNASLLLFNLLNWSKSQMQSLEPKPSLFDVQEVFEDKVKLFEQRMENKGISLKNNSLRDFAYADRSMFEIVVQNLLANALKFCKNDDNITIANHISDGNCIISISDTGIGIPEKNIEKLFQNTSFSTTGTNNEKGTGLGLSICKELIELNNGKIWVESKINQGSTFYVQLPKSKVAS